MAKDFDVIQYLPVLDNFGVHCLVLSYVYFDTIIIYHSPRISGSTMIAAIMEDNRYLSVINVGDSRAVACDLQNQVVSLSKDHKPDDVSRNNWIMNWDINVFGTTLFQGFLSAFYWIWEKFEVRATVAIFSLCECPEGSKCRQLHQLKSSSPTFTKVFVFYYFVLFELGAALLNWCKFL